MPHAMLLTAPRRLELRECARRDLMPFESRVAVTLAGVCGTDLAIWSGAYPVPLPLVLGHEWVGRVVEVGAAGPRNLWGRRITAEINNHCRARAERTVCAACRRGLPTHCLTRTVTGIVCHEGAFQQELIVPTRLLHPIPDAIPDAEAVFLEPLAAALQTFELSPVQRGANVVVLGVGRLGILCALVAHAKGARVLAVARSTASLRHARRLGLDTFRAPSAPRQSPKDPLAPAPSALLDELHARTRGLGADLVVEATGNPQALELALDLVRPRGIIALKSTPGQPAPEFSLTRFVVNEVRLQGSRCGPFDEAIRFQARHRLPLESLVSRTYPLRSLDKAFQTAATRPGKVHVRIG